MGENGTGKTHLMKALYSACQAAIPKASFPNKIVRTMLPDEFNISRLVTRGRGNHAANIKISAKLDEKTPIKSISTGFNIKTKNGMHRLKEKKTGEGFWRD